MIKQAIETLDKATPGPWASAKEAPDWIRAERKGETFHVADVRGWGTLEKEGQKGCDELSANIALIAAAPDMAAWIKKALPYLKVIQSNGSLSLGKFVEVHALVEEATE